MEASKTWDGRGKTAIERIVFTLFKNLLYERYLTVGDDPHNSDEYETFNENTFVEILKRLHKMNSNDYPYNPDVAKAYFMDYYIYKLYNLLGVDCKMFDYVPSSQDLYYSSINKEFDRNISISSFDNTKPHIPGFPPYILNPDVGVYKDDGHPPSILIITREYLLNPFLNNKIVDDDVKRELTSMKQKIIYNGFEYNLDSVYLVNVNRTGFDHAIVGMTCKQKKFIFNSHPLYEKNFPCVLIPHKWNILQDRDFYLWDNDCELHDKPQKTNRNRYNFSEGRRRFIYVRKSASRDTSHSKESDVKKYFETRAISRERKEAARLEEEREAARLEEEREAVRLEEEIESVRLRDEEHKKIKEQRKKIEDLWNEEVEIKHYEEQMALIKEEERKRHKRLSDERKLLHKSSPQIDELIKIMSNFTLDDKKINKKRIRKSNSGSNNSGSNSGPKVIKRRPLKRIRKAIAVRGDL
jgi:hypothetical protein